jgi:microcystin degradation protein MlrC
VGGVIDLHANFTGTMARCASALIAYRENPHIDAKESAIRAMRTLVRAIESGDLPDTVWERPAILWAPTGTGTAADPMLSLERRAREIEREHGEILAVNVMPGFAFADVPEAGLSFTAVTLGNAAAARLELASLSRLAHDLKALGVSADIPVDEAMRKLAAHREGPIVLVEPSDNVGGGAPGDGTGLLRALVEHRVRGVVVINDPAAVAKLAAVNIGATIRLPIGGKGSRLDAGPLVLDIEHVSQSDGRFTLEDPHSHLASMVGSQVDMGPCAVVRHEGVTILLTSKKTPPFDLGQLRSQGIVPEEQFAIVVKAAVAHARAYDPISKASYWVDTPGPCSGNLKSLPYRKVRRPIYPLDF